MGKIREAAIQAKHVCVNLHKSGNDHNKQLLVLVRSGANRLLLYCVPAKKDVLILILFNFFSKGG